MTLLWIYLTIGALLYILNIKAIKDSPWYHYPILFVGMVCFWAPGLGLALVGSWKKFTGAA